MSMAYSIYGLKSCYDNTIRYIGLTKQPLRKRLASHAKDMRRNRHKANWIKSCNGNIEIVEIQTGIETLSEANKLEQDYIACFRSLGIPLLNATIGGDGTQGMSSWNKGVPCFYRDKLIGNHPAATSVAAYTLEGHLVNVFPSIKNASAITGVSRNSICCQINSKKKYKQSKGLTFRHVDGTAPQKIQPVCYDKQARIKSLAYALRKKRKKVVVCIDGIDVVYNDINTAAFAHGISKASVRAYCSKQLTSNGKKFSYYNS